MKYEIKAGDFELVFYLGMYSFEHFCSGLQLANYKIEIHKNGEYIPQYEDEIYNKIGLDYEEFKSLLIEGTRVVIEMAINREIENDPRTSIRSWIFFAVHNGGETYNNMYGFSQHDIFKCISDRYHCVHEQGYDGGSVYVHSYDLIPEYDDWEDDYILSLDFEADYELIEELKGKIMDYQHEKDEEDIDSLIDEILEDM